MLEDLKLLNTYSRRGIKFPYPITKVYFHLGFRRKGDGRRTSYAGEKVELSGTGKIHQSLLVE